MKWTTVSGKWRVLKDLLRFYYEQKMWWMIPLVLLLILVGVLVVGGQQGALSPFLYTLF